MDEVLEKNIQAIKSSHEYVKYVLQRYPECKGIILSFIKGSQKYIDIQESIAEIFFNEADLLIKKMLYDYKGQYKISKVGEIRVDMLHALEETIYEVTVKHLPKQCKDEETYHIYYFIKDSSIKNLVHNSSIEFVNSNFKNKKIKKELYDKNICLDQAEIVVNITRDIWPVMERELRKESRKRGPKMDATILKIIKEYLATFKDGINVSLEKFVKDYDIPEYYGIYNFIEEREKINKKIERIRKEQLINPYDSDKKHEIDNLEKEKNKKYPLTKEITIKNLEDFKKQFATQNLPQSIKASFSELYLYPKDREKIKEFTEEILLQKIYKRIGKICNYLLELEGEMNIRLLVKNKELRAKLAQKVNSKIRVN